MSFSKAAARAGALVSTAVALAGCGTSALRGDPAVGVSVNQVLKGIRCEFVSYVKGSTGQKRFKAIKPWVIQGQLVVSATNESGVKGGATLKSFAGATPFGIGFEGGVTKRDTSSLTVDFSLDPGDKPPADCVRPDPGFGLAEWLEEVEEAKKGNEGLALNDHAFVFGLTFGVFATAGVSGSFGVQSVGLEASALRKRDDVQTLMIAIKPAPGRQVIYVQQVQPEGGRTKSRSESEAGMFQMQRVPTRAVPVRVVPDLGPQLQLKRREMLGPD